MSATSLSQRIREMAAEQPMLEVAQFQFIGLEDIQAAYGERWPRHKQRIRDVAKGFLEKRLDRADALIQGTDGFVVVLGACRGEEAQCVAASLSQGLNDFILGELRDHRGPKVQVETRSVPVEQLIETLGQTPFVRPEPDPPREVSDETMEWVFQPVWNLKREALTSYYVLPMLRDEGRRVPGYLFEPDNGPATPYDQVDVISLERSEAAIQSLFASGRRAFVGVSVHVQSLTNVESRARILAAIAKFDRSYMRYRLLKISAVPPGFPRMYLSEIVGILKSRIPNIVVSTSMDETSFASLARCGLSGFGVALPPHMTGPASPYSQSDMLLRLKQAVGAASAAKAEFYVDGAISPQLVMRLAPVGVDSVSSIDIWPSRSSLDGVVKWTADRLMEA
ncbi:MAG: hypothetical protein R3C52_02350 [Hyphomonadaceae bacterium]